MAISARGTILILSSAALLYPVVNNAGMLVPIILPRTATNNKTTPRSIAAVSAWNSSCNPILIKKKGTNNSYKVPKEASIFTASGSRLKANPAKKAPIATEKPNNPAKAAITIPTPATINIGSGGGSNLSKNLVIGRSQ